jgi:glycosyltransferase involved in cell wall biosynthesis
LTVRVLLLLPAYQAGRHLDALLTSIRAQELPVPCDICVVDDGSSDDTGDRARAHAGVTVLVHERNRGKGAALRTGFDHAVREGYDAVVTMDADGQHLPEELHLFLTAWRDGADVVVGNRMAANTNMPWLRKRTNEFTSWVVGRLAALRLPDSQNGYRLFDTKVLRSVELESDRYDMESEILIKAGRLGYRVDSVTVTTVYHDEVSSIHPFVDTVRFFRLVGRSLRWRRQPGRRTEV